MEFIMNRNLNNARNLLKLIGNTRLPGGLRNVRRVCQFDDTRWTNRLYDTTPQYWLSASNSPITNSLYTFRNLKNQESISKNIHSLCYSTLPKDDSKPKEEPTGEPKKVSIFQKMKQLTKDYWHILIPVHIVTSIGWVSIFYVAAKNGVDVVKLMEYLHLSEKYINVIKNSNAGHWAVVYALYKIFTPMRYTITVGGTTLAIRYLDKLGIMKFRRSTKATPTRTTNNANKKGPNENNQNNLKSN